MDAGPTTPPAAKAPREHYWDALRAFLMLLGIPYHTALSYRPVGREWIVNAGPGGSEAFTYLAEFLHLFRMPAFFIVAGYFSAMLLARRSPRVWLRGRWRRIGIPFAFSLVTFVPLMNMACELSNLPPAEALASWLHNSLTSAGYWIRHLWFVIVLLYCSTAAALAAWRFPALRGAMLPPRADRWIARRFAACLLALSALLGLWQAVAVEAFYTAGLATNVPQELLRIDELIVYAPYFLIGCAIARTPAVLRRLGTFSPVVTLVALVFTVVSVAGFDSLVPMTGRFVGTFASLATTQVVIAGARRLSRGPSPLVGKLVSASFVMYLVHMPIIVVLVALAARMPGAVADKALAVMLLTFALSYGAWLAVARSRLLSFAFNGEPLRWRERPRAAA